MKPFTLLICSVALLVACKSGKEGQAPAPAAKPSEGGAALAAIADKPSSGTKPDLNLVMTVHADQGFAVPCSHFDTKDAIEDITDAMGMTISEENVIERKTLADGWSLTYRLEDMINGMSERKLAGKIIQCDSWGGTQAELDVGRATCLAMTTVGTSDIAIPFQMPTDEENFQGNGVWFQLEPVSKDAPGSARAAVEQRLPHTGKVITGEVLPNGFTVTYSGKKDDQASGETVYGAYARLEVGTQDLVCSAKDVDDQEKLAGVLSMCRGLRAL
jgi:hypothetical protein